MYVLNYCIAGKFDGEELGEFGELSVIRQTKIIQISNYNKQSIGWSINSLKFLSPKARTESIHQTFSLYNI